MKFHQMLCAGSVLRRTSLALLIHGFALSAHADAERAFFLEAQALSSSDIRLAWQDRFEVETGFCIERSTNDRAYTVTHRVEPGVTTHTDSGLEPGRLYLYRVIATGVSADLGRSNMDYAVTLMPVTPTVAPEGLVTYWGASKPTQQVVLTWNRNLHDQGYEIERSTRGDDAFERIATTGTGAQTFTDVGVSPTADYRYRIRAVGAASHSAYSATSQPWLAAEFTGGLPVIFSNQLTPPSALVATAPTVSQIELAWQDHSADETNFLILRSSDGLIFKGISSVEAGVTRYVDASILRGITYFYRVLATRGTRPNAHYSVFSETVTARVDDNPELMPPSALTAVVDASGVALAWCDNSAHETGFAIERKMAGQNFARIATVGAGVTTFDDSQGVLHSGYRVQALRANEASAYGDHANAMAAPIPTAAPTGFAATVISSNRIDLSWSSAPGGYLIERAPGGSAFEAVAYVKSKTGAATCAFEDRALAPGTAYRYRVRAYDPAAAPFSAPLSATTMAISAPPDAPAALTAARVSPGQINLQWQDHSSSETSYVVQRSDTGGPYATVATLPADSVFHADAGLASHTAHRYRLQAVNGLGASAWVNVETLTTAVPDPAVTLRTRESVECRELIIHGTAANDRIIVSQIGQDISISANGASLPAQKGPFGMVTVRGGDGDDHISLHENVSCRTLLYGGHGNDELIASGSGKSVIVSLGEGRDAATGNGLNTSYWGDPDGIDTISSTPAEQAAGRVHRIASFYQPETFDPANAAYRSKELNAPGWSDPWPNDSGTTRFPENSLWGLGATVFDVDQGFHQDCPFASLYGSIARQQPDLIEELAVDLGDGTYAVRFGAVEMNLYTRLDGDVSPTTVSEPGPSGNQWWLILEKAYVFGYGLPGNDCTVTAQLNPRVPPTGPFESMREALDKKECVTAWTSGGQELGAHLVPQNHCYTVVEAYEDAERKRYVTVRNPYGKQLLWNIPPREAALGLVTLSWDQFYANFYTGVATRTHLTPPPRPKERGRPAHE